MEATFEPCDPPAHLSPHSCADSDMSPWRWQLLFSLPRIVNVELYLLPLAVISKFILVLLHREILSLVLVLRYFLN